MNFSVLSLRMPFLISAIFLISGCGGGGDNAGDVASFSVNPEEVTWSGPKSKCLTGEYIAGGVSTHVINGGVPPFRIVASDDSVFLPKTLVDGKDPSFDISFSGSCASEFSTSVIVLDYHSKMVTISIKTANFDDEVAITQ